MSTARPLLYGIGFIAAVMLIGTVGYVAHGWSWADAFYMVVLTIYTVGFGEVRPIDTPGLRLLTIGIIVMGCTGMIYVTGALVQFITVNQLRDLLGNQRMKAQLNELKNHVVICGYGRIGAAVAHEMAAGRAPFIVVERSATRIAQARERGHLAIEGDATDEATLRTAGIERARAVASVLPDDAANVFIVLSARSLNSGCEIIARGEAASTERKLRQAGANHVVMPAHIGAERVAEIILYPGSAGAMRAADRAQDFDRELSVRGLARETFVASERGDLDGLTIAELRARMGGDALVVALNRRSGEVETDPVDESRIEAGDGVVLLCHAERAGGLRAAFGVG